MNITICFQQINRSLSINLIIIEINIAYRIKCIRTINLRSESLDSGIIFRDSVTRSFYNRIYFIFSVFQQCIQIIR